MDLHHCGNRFLSAVYLLDLCSAAAGEVLGRAKKGNHYDDYWHFANRALFSADCNLYETAGRIYARLFEGERTFLHPVLRWLEVLTYKVAGVKEDVEQKWTHYTASLLSFSIFGFVILYMLQRLQGLLPPESPGF